MFDLIKCWKQRNVFYFLSVFLVLLAFTCTAYWEEQQGFCQPESNDWVYFMQHRQRIFSHHPNLDIGWLDSYQLNITNTAIRSFSLTSEPHPHSQSQNKRSNRVNSEARTHRIQLIYISLFTALGRGKIVNTFTHEY